MEMRRKVLLLLSLCLCLLVLVKYSPLNKTEALINSKHMREVNGLQLIFNSVRTEKEKMDEQYVIVDITLVNNSTDVINFSPQKVTIVDIDGYAYNYDSSFDTKGILGGQLHPGRKARGELAFLVPIEKSYELVYTDHLRTGQVTWDIVLNKE